MKRSCAQCQKPYEAMSPRSRYCSGTCRVRAHNLRKKAAVVAELAPAPTDRPPSVAATVRAELSAVGRLATTAGAAAMALAVRIDAQAETGAGVAALVKQLHATMTVATADVQVAVDPLDELRARREARRGA